MVSISPARRLKPALVPALLIAGLTQLTGAANPAQAHGFLSQLFGFATPVSPASQRATPAKPRSAAAPAPQTSTRWIVVDDRDRPERRVGNRGARAEGSGSYTTMCVRMCDGFYFPISHRVPRNRFGTDAEACRNRCGASDARLFYFASAGGDMDSAVDQTGRSYARLPMAFAHRKRLVAGCTCRPEPWSQAAAIRHEGYAIAEGRSLSGGSDGLGALTVVAGNYDKRAEPAPSAEPDEAAAASGAQTDTARNPDTTDLSAKPLDDDSGVPFPNALERPVQPARVHAAAPSVRRTAPPANRPTTRVPASRQVQQAQPRKPTRVASASPAGGTRLVWPGDAPARVR